MYKLLDSLKYKREFEQFFFDQIAVIFESNKKDSGLNFKQIKNMFIIRIPNEFESNFSDG